MRRNTTGSSPNWKSEKAETKEPEVKNGYTAGCAAGGFSMLLPCIVHEPRKETPVFLYLLYGIYLVKKKRIFVK